jgi:hypothetical protein
MIFAAQSAMLGASAATGVPRSVQHFRCAAFLFRATLCVAIPIARCMSVVVDLTQAGGS